MFSINNKNTFGDIQYIEDLSGSFAHPVDAGVWTIKNPSSECIEWYSTNLPTAVVRTYQYNTYIMSQSASEKIKEYGFGQGETCIIKFYHNDTPYFLFTLDNKPYLQNVQGSREKTDSVDGDCIIREIREEVGVEISKSDITRIGEWSFLMKNNLVDSSWPASTTLFYSCVDFSKVAHLFTNVTLDTSEPTIIDASSYTFKLDETRFVVCIPEKIMERVPDMIVADKPYRFSGHQRECIHRILQLTKSYPVDYLHSFNVLLLPEFTSI